MGTRSNRALKILLVVVIVLVALRIALPFIVTRYVNNVLSDIPGYRGQIDGVTIHLIRGAYQIDSLKMFKIDGNKEVPFIDIPVMDLSVEWGALVNGKVVGEIHFENPVLNFIGEKKDKSGGESATEQSGEDVDWTRPIKKLMPLQINHLTIKDGSIAFYDFSTDPHVDLFLREVQLEAENLNNARDNTELLPSRVHATARSIGNGMLTMNMRINVLKELPDLDADIKFENVNMPALNDFFEAYARVDIEKGAFNLYSEVAVLNGKVTGYVKPLFNNLKVVDWDEEKKKPIELAWESVVGFLVEVFENQKKNQFATRVPLDGQIAEVQSPFWPALWNIFRNAFVKAFERNTDGSVTIAGGKEKNKKESKKERRQRKKKERKEERDEKRGLP
jgi:hypothetical protein